MWYGTFLLPIFPKIGKLCFRSLNLQNQISLLEVASQHFAYEVTDFFGIKWKIHRLVLESMVMHIGQFYIKWHDENLSKNGFQSVSLFEALQQKNSSRQTWKMKKFNIPALTNLIVCCLLKH